MENITSNAAALHLQEQLTGALIGIARAVEGNEHLISASTDKILREGLSASLPGTNSDTDSLSALIRAAEEEKRKLVPHCYECAAPCGKNNNYDIRRLDTAEEDIGALKLLLLYGIRSLAACVCRADALGQTDPEVGRFFYQALFAIGEESFGVGELLSLVKKFGKMNARCMALVK